MASSSKINKFEVESASETTWQYADACLIVVGCGEEADEVLARRRLEAGGRLCHITTAGPEDARVRVSDTDGGEGFFFWLTPPASVGISSLGRKLCAKVRRYWTKDGPDAFELPADHSLLVMRCNHGDHVYVTDGQGFAVCAMSGQVVVDPDIATAKTLDVGVRDQDSRSFGTFSWRFVIPAQLLLLVWQVGKMLLSIHHEMLASEGAMPWWRNLLMALTWALVCQAICTEMLTYAIAGEKPSGTILQVSSMAAAMAILAATPLEFSDFILCVVGLGGALVGPIISYVTSRHKFPQRRFLSSLLWTIGQLAGTAGCYVLMGAVGLVYALLIEGGFAAVASIYLPFATAFAELGMIIYTRPPCYSSFLLFRLDSAAPEH